MTFRSRIDLWLFLAPAVVLGSVIVAVVCAPALPHGPRMVAVAVPVIVGCIIAFAMFTTKYVVADGVLTVKTSFRRWTIAVRDIRQVTPTRDARSAPALSLHRLRIEWAEGMHSRELMVSPADPDAFVAALRAVSPSIRYHPVTHANP